MSRHKRNVNPLVGFSTAHDKKSLLAKKKVFFKLCECAYKMFYVLILLFAPN